MTRSRQVLCALYALVSIAALFATWGQNAAYFADPSPSGPLGAFAAFLIDTKANPATRSITVDIALFLLAAAAFMITEARRVGVRFVWLYILFGFLVAISVTFPLFMIARETRLATAQKSDAEAALTFTDYAGFAVVAAVVAGLCWFILN